MRNIKLTIAYDGSKYAGWQTQKSHVASRKPHVKTIQEEIEKALQKIFQKKIPLVGSGRTDSGVHAFGQVANFKIDRPMALEKLQKALNGILSKDIAILKVEAAPLKFHARFQAKSKIYRYIIICSPAKTAFAYPWAFWVRTHLDAGLMQREAGCLLGRHDFKSFQASDRKERHSVTIINKIQIKKHKGRQYFPFLNRLEAVVIDIEASGFLRNMVRNIVGTLIDIGRKKIKKGALKEILKKKDRRCAGFCAPACGLYLLDVSYA